eukprot:c22857_g2_i3 orf=190-567(+)
MEGRAIHIQLPPLSAISAIRPNVMQGKQHVMQPARFYRYKKTAAKSHMARNKKTGQWKKRERESANSSNANYINYTKISIAYRTLGPESSHRVQNATERFRNLQGHFHRDLRSMAFLVVGESEMP